ncbi:hypothetical protein HHL08_14220 [Sphingobium sp. AR-3-1]|uniref:Uncharacterized protein n=1 Tax=Sphingobium psychrophilum TaxID=2728834 RepID=A0A7X9ZT61_9SPHN|nr:hypothetical protein [Sphingobium psychrophilum]NML11287.1 hypothetical protein [Sphingobium psychrophilum]
MSDRDTMLALAERVESGPDREVDAAIHYDVLGWCRHANTVRSGAQSDTGFECIDCGADSWGNKSNRGQGLRDRLPAYTASIDAAMTLVPPDSWHEIKGPRKYLNIPSPVPNYWSAHLARWNHEGDAMGWGATPALALTAAALRARAQSQGDGHD